MSGKHSEERFLWIQCSTSAVWIRNVIVHFGFCRIIELLPPFRWRLRSDRLQTWWSPNPNPKRRRRRRIPMSPPSPCRPTPSSSETPRQPSRDRIPTPPLETYPRSWLPCGTGWGRSRSRYESMEDIKKKNFHCHTDPKCAHECRAPVFMTCRSCCFIVCVYHFHLSLKSVDTNLHRDGTRGRVHQFSVNPE